jgi:hypothetical protein
LRVVIIERKRKKRFLGFLACALELNTKREGGREGGREGRRDIVGTHSVVMGWGANDFEMRREGMRVGGQEGGREGGREDSCIGLCSLSFLLLLRHFWD